MFKKYKKVIYNNKVRILYKLDKSKSLYIKYKNEFILYSYYKKIKKGGMKDIFSKLNVKEPICETRECIISLKSIPKDKLIVLKDVPYNVSKLQKWINSQKSDVKTDVYRRPLNMTEIQQVQKKYDATKDNIKNKPYKKFAEVNYIK